MQGIVDRIEEDVVVIELNEKMYNVNIDLVDGEVVEGDVVYVVLEDDSDKITYVKKDQKETLSREEYIKEITKDMWE